MISEIGHLLSRWRVNKKLKVTLIIINQTYNKLKLLKYEERNADCMSPKPSLLTKAQVSISIKIKRKNV